MNQGNNNNSQNRVQDFLEALRERQAASGTVETGYQQVGGYESFVEKRKTEELRRAEFHQNQKRKERELVSVSKREEERRVIEIQEQLVKMTENGKVEETIRKVVITETRNAGLSDLNFFEHILRMIRLNPKNSGEWLSMYNSRSKKVGTYWQMAQKGGTKFTQALDRNVATSVG